MNGRETQVQRLQWTPELVERFWAGVAQTRLAECSFSRQGGNSLIMAIEHHLPRVGSVLDYGAGDGDLVGLLVDRGYKVAAYEPSTNRSGRFVSRFSGKEGFLGVLGTEAKKQFDVVLMIEVIEHILDQELDEVLRRVHGLLTEGGTLIVTTPNSEDLELGMAYCPVSNMLFHRWQHVRSFTAESLALLLGQYGISPVVVHHVEFRSGLSAAFDSSQLQALGADIPVRVGSEANLLFVGRKAKVLP